MIDVTLPQGLLSWMEDHRDLAYFLGFVLLSLIVYGLFPFTIGLNHATSTQIPYRDINIGKQIQKRHRILLLAGAILVFAVLHFGLFMPGFALIGGATLLGALAVLDHLQIWRDYPLRII
jgi:hypothetical protein